MNENIEGYASAGDIDSCEDLCGKATAKDKESVLNGLKRDLHVLRRYEDWVG